MLVIREDSVTESDGEPSLRKKVIAAPAKSMQVLKASAVINGLTAGSDANHIQHVVPTTSQPKPKLTGGQPAPPAAAQVPTKASKPTSKHNHSNNSDVGVEKQEHPQPTGSKSKLSEAKMEVAKAKEVLRDAQEMVKKAQGV